MPPSEHSAFLKWFALNIHSQINLEMACSNLEQFKRNLFATNCSFSLVEFTLLVNSTLFAFMNQLCLCQIQDPKMNFLNCTAFYVKQRSVIDQDFHVVLKK